MPPCQRLGSLKLQTELWPCSHPTSSGRKFRGSPVLSLYRGAGLLPAETAPAPSPPGRLSGPLSSRGKGRAASSGRPEPGRKPRELSLAQVTAAQPPPLPLMPDSHGHPPPPPPRANLLRPPGGLEPKTPPEALRTRARFLSPARGFSVSWERSRCSAQNPSMLGAVAFLLSFDFFAGSPRSPVPPNHVPSHGSSTMGPWWPAGLAAPPQVPSRQQGLLRGSPALAPGRLAAGPQTPVVRKK